MRLGSGRIAIGRGRCWLSRSRASELDSGERCLAATQPLGDPIRMTTASGRRPRAWQRVATADLWSGPLGGAHRSSGSETTSHFGGGAPRGSEYEPRTAERGSRRSPGSVDTAEAPRRCCLHLGLWLLGNGTGHRIAVARDASRVKGALGRQSSTVDSRHGCGSPPWPTGLDPFGRFSARGAGRRRRTRCRKCTCPTRSGKFACGGDSSLLTRDPVRARTATKHPGYAPRCAC